jgi:hypothetical protein
MDGVYGSDGIRKLSGVMSDYLSKTIGHLNGTRSNFLTLNDEIIEAVGTTIFSAYR